MRHLVSIAILLTTITSLRAQEQESKLLDRLLRPNAAMENSAQRKQFVADGKANSKAAEVKSFAFQDRVHANSFAEQRSFRSQSFSTAPASTADKRANLATRSQFTRASAIYPTQRSRFTNASPAAGKRAATSQFADNHPFSEQGKSQKSLNRQNPPMTIEQVRELLNKNK